MEAAAVVRGSDRQGSGVIFFLAGDGSKSGCRADIAAARLPSEPTMEADVSEEARGRIAQLRLGVSVDPHQLRVRQSGCCPTGKRTLAPAMLAPDLLMCDSLSGVEVASVAAEVDCLSWGEGPLLKARATGLPAFLSCSHSAASSTGLDRRERERGGVVTAGAAAAAEACRFLM